MANPCPSSETGSDRREHERSLLLYSGSLYDGEQMVDCVIKDISATGARVMVERRLGKQQELVLDLDSVGLFPSRIVWQSDDHAGIRFLDGRGAVNVQTFR